MPAMVFCFEKNQQVFDFGCLALQRMHQQWLRLVRSHVTPVNAYVTSVRSVASVRYFRLLRVMNKRDVDFRLLWAPQGRYI